MPVTVDLAIESLPPEVQAKAERELNEVLQFRQDAIDAFKNLIHQEGLRGCLADGFLLRFLRARKFDIQQALHQYRAYYTARHSYPDIFRNLRPTVVSHMFKAGVVVRLPKPNVDGCALIYFHPASWDPTDWPAVDLHRASVLLTEELLLRCPVAQVNGVVVLVNFTGFSWRQGVHTITPSFVRKTACFLQDCTPVRIKAIHVFNEHTLCYYTYRALRPLLKRKLLSRIKFHGKSLKSLHASIPPHLLPSNVDLGGTGPAILYQNYLDDLLGLEDYFIKMEQIPNITRRCSLNSDMPN